MNFTTYFNHIPQRENKPRTRGITMVMDKGLSVREAEDFVDVSAHLVDYVKLGFGTSVISNRVKEKVKIYQQADIKVYCGGTLFEAFLIRNQIEDYLRYIDYLGVHAIEISDGSMDILPEKKYELIRKLSQNYHVVSEVGSKDANTVLSNDTWVASMQNELQAGSALVIAEARESGNVGIYKADGKVNQELIEQIQATICFDRILWEAPQKSQQTWFIKNFGYHINLGNIAPNELISLETLRLGLRGDTFHDFLNHSN